MTITEQTLTRAESADKLKYIWSTIVEESPDSTNAIRDKGAVSYVVQGFDVLGVHEDHLEWLWPRLGKTGLDEIDLFAVKMRALGSATDVPWRDAAAA